MLHIFSFFLIHFQFGAVQKCTHLVELEKCCILHIYLQNLVLIQPRTSPPKICKFWKKVANFAMPWKFTPGKFQAVPLGLREVPAGHPRAVGRVEAAGLWS